MNNSFQFEPHRSSLGNMDANILALLAYLLGWIVGFIPFLQGFSWLVPLVIFLMEKDSPLVKFHAMQSFLLNIITVALAVLIGIVLGGGALLSFFGALGNSSTAAGAFLGTSVMALLLIAVVCIGAFVFAVISMIKAYHYQAYRIPIVGNWAAKIARLDR